MLPGVEEESGRPTRFSLRVPVRNNLRAWGRDCLKYMVQQKVGNWKLEAGQQLLQDCSTYNQAQPSGGATIVAEGKVQRYPPEPSKSFALARLDQRQRQLEYCILNS